MKTFYLIIGTLITLLLFYMIRELEKGNKHIKKMFYQRSQMIKFKKDEGE